MSGIIHFGSGKTLKISDYEMRNMPVELASKGIKVKKLRSSGHLVPMNSHTIEFIEQVEELVQESCDTTIDSMPEGAKPLVVEQKEQTAAESCPDRADKTEVP